MQNRFDSQQYTTIDDSQIKKENIVHTHTHTHNSGPHLHNTSMYMSLIDSAEEEDLDLEMDKWEVTQTDVLPAAVCITRSVFFHSQSIPSSRFWPGRRRVLLSAPRIWAAHYTAGLWTFLCLRAIWTWKITDVCRVLQERDRWQCPQAHMAETFFTVIVDWWKCLSQLRSQCFDLVEGFHGPL